MTDFFDSTDPFFDFFKVWDSEDMSFLLDKKDESLNLFKLLINGTANVSTILSNEDILTKVGGLLDNISREALAADSPFLNKHRRVVNIKDPIYEGGAVGNGNDDNVAIASAIEDCGLNDILLFPTDPVGFGTTEQIVVPVGINVWMDAPLVSSVDGAPSLVIGTEGEVNRYRKHLIRVKRNSLSDWSDEADIGVKLFSHYNSFIEILESDSFTIGAQCLGSDSRGWVYNAIKLGRLINNKIGLDLAQETLGWVNDNLWQHGSFRCDTGINTSEDRIGIRIRSIDDTYNNNNTNVFIKPSFELQDGGTGEALPILVQAGVNNFFMWARGEANDPVFIRTTDDSQKNTCVLAFGQSSEETWEDLGNYPSTVFVKSVEKNQEESKRLVWASPPFHKVAVPYNSTQTHVPRATLNSSSAATSIIAATSITIGADYLEYSSRALGVFVDTRRCKRFTIITDCETSFGGRLIVRCYSEADAILTDADPGHPYVKSVEDTGFSFNSAYGGVYQTGSDSNRARWIVVGADVAYVYIGITGGTAAIRARGMQIYTPDLDGTTTWIEPARIRDGVPVVVEVPASGTWEKGQRLRYDAPDAAEFEGIVCVTAGSPGTWKDYGEIGA